MVSEIKDTLNEVKDDDKIMNATINTL